MKSRKLEETRKPAGTVRRDSRKTPPPTAPTSRAAPSRRRRTNPRDGAAVLVVGASGSGKTSWCIQQLPGSAPLLVWDSPGVWSRTLGLRRVSSIRELAQLIIADGRGEYPGAFRVGYVGPVDSQHFESFCGLAWVWIRQRRGNNLVVEELSDVTTPGKAPRSWGSICRRNRGEGGGKVFAITQRPQESDKTILGNCALIHCGRLNSRRDRRYMADILDVDIEDITALEDLDYLHRDMRTHQLSRGRVHNPSVK